MHPLNGLTNARGPRAALAPVIVSATLAVAALAPSGSVGAATGWTDTALPTSLNVGGTASVASISCPTTDRCFAGGRYRDAGGIFRAFIASWGGAGWIVSPLVLPAGFTDTSSVESISCPTVAFCAVAGQLSDAADTRQAFAATWSGGAWTVQVLAGDKNTGRFGFGTSVACASPTNCLAGGEYEAGIGSQEPFASHWDGTSWSTTTLATSLNGGGLGLVTSVSCSGAAFCVAGGYATEIDGTQDAFVANEVAGAWGETSVASEFNVYGDAKVSAVSCASTTFCVAVGRAYDGVYGYQAFVSRWNGTTWTDRLVATDLNTQGVIDLNAVSCTSSSFCVAGGFFLTSAITPMGVRNDAFVTTWDGHTWSDRPVATSLNAGGSGVVNAISCSQTSCAIGGRTIDGRQRTQPFVDTVQSGIWSDSVPASSLGGSQAEVLTTSCASPSVCMVGGDLTDASNHQQAFAALSGTATAPSAPQHLVAAPSDGQVSLTWTPPAHLGGTPISTYSVFSSTDHGTTWQPQASCSGTALSCVVTGLTNGVEVTFDVEASNVAGTGPAAVTGPVTPIAAPSPPSALALTAATGSLTVRWQAAPSTAGAPVVGYRVTLSPSGATCTTSLLTCTIGELPSTEAQTATVVATNTTGSSAAVQAGPIYPFAAKRLAVELGQSVAAVGTTVPVIVAGSTVGASVKVAAGAGSVSCTLSAADQCVVMVTPHKVGLLKVVASVGKVVSTSVVLYTPKVTAPTKVRVGSLMTVNFTNCPPLAHVQIIVAGRTIVAGTTSTTGTARISVRPQIVGPTSVAVTVNGVSLPNLSVAVSAS